MKPKLLWVLVMLLALACVGLWGVGEMLSAPSRSSVGPPPSALSGRSVSLATTPGQVVSGWFAAGAPGRGAVLLLHGVRGDRRQMLGRALALHAEGYAVLLIDLPSHGESSGERITFGFREAEGVRASMRFLRDSAGPGRVAVIGVSLGAAALALADVVPPPDAVVLESMYPTIDEAVSDRLRLRAGAAGAAFAPLLVRQIPWRLGIAADQLRPIDHVARIGAPLMIAAGTEDRLTTIAETRRIYERAASPKELWLIEGAGHVDLYDFDPRAYRSRAVEFVKKHLSIAG